MLRSVRIVISKNQDRINDPNIGNKGLDGKAVLAEAGAIYQQASGTAPASIDPNSLHGRLIRMQIGFHRRSHGGPSGDDQSPRRRVQRLYSRRVRAPGE